MSYQSMLLGRLHLVCWGSPTSPDVDRLVNETKAARRASEEPLVGVAIVPSDVQPPSDDIRAAMARRMEELLEQMEFMYIVLLGSGFKQSIMRSVFAGLILFGGKRGKISVESRLEVAVDQAAGRAGLAASAVMREAERRGLMVAAKSATH